MRKPKKTSSLVRVAQTLRNTLSLAAVAMATIGCSVIRALDSPPLPPLSEREPAFLAYCEQLRTDRRCDPGGGRCWRVLDRNGREIAPWDPDQEWGSRNLRASCEVYERDKADPCLLESELLRSQRLLPSEQPLVNQRGSLYTFAEARSLCQQQSAHP